MTKPLDFQGKATYYNGTPRGMTREQLDRQERYPFVGLNSKVCHATFGHGRLGFIKLRTGLALTFSGHSFVVMAIYMRDAACFRVRVMFDGKGGVFYI